MSGIGNNLLNKLRKRLKAALRKPPALPIIYNVNSDRASPDRRRALLVYLVKPFLLDPNDPQFLTHQNLKQCKQIAAILGESHHTVDVADRHNFRNLKRRDYDLIISDRADLKGIESFRTDATKIFLATSMNYALHNSNVRRRHELVSQRRNFDIEIRRIYPEVMPYIAHADSIVGFGNEFIMSTWHQLSQAPTYPFNNYGFEETAFLCQDKNFATARKNFLFFASRSQMQKGLDLLLDIFAKHPDLHLYVCSEFQNEQDFCALYHKELFATPNIHPIGWVTVQQTRYNELVRNCAYVIHPTCSEGQPGSVVQCMYSGLIPLVTKWAGIDTDDFGVTFADDTLEEIEKTVVTVSQLPEEWHRSHSMQTRQVAEAKYSEDAFIKRWRQMLQEIHEIRTTVTSRP